jgi:hypothetical protein
VRIQRDAGRGVVDEMAGAAASGVRHRSLDGHGTENTREL